MPLDPLIGTLVRGQPTTPAQATDLTRRFVVGQTLKGVVLRTLPEGQTLVNFAGQHAVLELPQSLSPGQTLLATVQHITPTLVLKVIGEPGAPGVNTPQTQVDRSGINYEAKVAEVLTQQATPAEQEALAHDLKGQLLELAARLDQASRQGNDVGESLQQVQQALNNIEFQQLSNLFAQQEHQSLLLQFLHPAFSTAHTARLYFRADPRDKGGRQADQQDYTLVFLLDFTALGHARIDATVRGTHVTATIRTTDEAVTHFIATHIPALSIRLHDLGFQAQIDCSTKKHVPLEVEDSFSRLLMADPSRLLDVTI